MNPRCEKCAKKVKKYTRCWRMPSETKCMMCLHQRQACSIDPGYSGSKKRRRTGTDASMRRKPSRGKYALYYVRFSANDVLLIVEARELVNEDRDVDAEAKIDLSEYMTIGETTTAGLEKARDTIQWRLKSSAFELC